MIKKASLFGLISAIAYILWLIIVVKTGLSKKEITFNFPLLINAIIISIPMYLGLQYIKKNQYDGSINYAQAFYSGAFISVFSGIFVFIILALFEKINFLIPELLAELKSSTLLYLQSEKKTPEEIKNIMYDYDSSFFIAKGHFPPILLMSIFSSTVVSLLVRNKDTFTETNSEIK